MKKLLFMSFVFGLLVESSSVMACGGEFDGEEGKVANAVVPEAPPAVNTPAASNLGGEDTKKP